MDYAPFSVQLMCSMLFALCLLGRMDTDVIQAARTMLQEQKQKDLKDPDISTRLAQIHLHCQFVLKMDSPLDSSMVENCMEKWKASLAEKRDPPKCVQDATELLEEMGFTYKVHALAPTHFVDAISRKTTNCRRRRNDVDQMHERRMLLPSRKQYLCILRGSWWRRTLA